MRDRTVKNLSKLHTLLFTVSGGRLGTRLVDNDMAVLTTTGRKTAKAHSVPLLVLTDGPDWIVVASYGGRPEHPQWYRNLVEQPSAILRVGAMKISVTAVTMDAHERALWWPRVVDAYSGYGVYASRTEREIPVVRLKGSP